MRGKIMTMRNMRFAASLSATVLVALSLLTPRAAEAKPAAEVSKAVDLSKDIGRTEPNKELNLTVILQLHNEAAYDKAIEALYDPASPTFHKWFTAGDFARYAPTQAEFETVKNELLRQGFTVLSSDPDRFTVRVHGTVAKAENAFQTEIHTLQYNGKTFDSPIREARLTGEAGALVSAVSGLERHQLQPNFIVAKNPRTGVVQPKKPFNVKESNGGSLASTLTDMAISAPQEFSYTSFGGGLPHAFYYGSAYDENGALTVSFTPEQLQAHYGLVPLIDKGYDGSGQTIALVEAYGYAAALTDANTAASIFGLPLMTSSNFWTVYPEGPPVDPNAADLTGWTSEIALDIQASHSIAPHAKIVVVASAGQDNEDQIASLQYIITNKVANTVSSSWENDSEIIAGPAEENAFNSVLKKGVAAGISFQFSTGDNGDEGLGTPVGSTGVPSDSPYATAVGGTSILNDPKTGGWEVAGWGNNAVYIALGGAADPPLQLGFLGGAGGGESIFFAKPSWQSALPGSGRQVPDVSALADPYTGFVIIYTTGGEQFSQAGIGGTSLASPIFTAIWAIADEWNGKPLGLASIPVSRLKAGQITDVFPNTDLNWEDPAGTIYDSGGATPYSTDGLFSGLTFTQTEFPSAVWPFDSEDAAVLSFGTDSSLTVTPGWDNVTGYGEPNGLPFLQGVTGKTVGAKP
jgi:subtilase family serine protease